ncbi:MAG TPA: hypothetical protein VFV52_16035 [Bacilli bacterium]|nr:hypothetical protein [Bacilli bacterium]
MARRFYLNWKAILSITVVACAIVFLYQWLKYEPADRTEFYLRAGDALFQFGLVLLMVGVVIFTRLFSMRRRMGLMNWMAMMRFKTREEAIENKNVEAELNEKDDERMKERGRDATWLIAAVLTIVIAIVLTNMGWT